jgi:hypothetical protein
VSILSDGIPQQDIPEVPELTLKRNHQVVSWPGDFEPFVLIFLVKHLAIFLKLLSNFELTHSQRRVARAAPASFIRRKVSVRRKEVGAKDPFVSMKVSPALFVLTQSVQLCLEDGVVPATWGCHCKKANISR